MKKTILSSLVALALGVPLLAQAAEGWVVDDITLQAGPDMDFPALADLEAGTPVSIQGCIDGWRWCDVIVEQDRGWVPGSYLEEEVGGRPVVVIDSGPRIGIPIVSFSLGTYWDRHYHNRPFYSERHRFESHAIAAHAPPRPARVAATAPRHDVHVRARTDFAAQVRGNTQGQDRNASASTTTTTMQGTDNRTATRDHTRSGTATTAASATAQQSTTSATADRQTRTVNRETPNYHRRADEKTDTQTAQHSAPRRDESQPSSPTDTSRRERPVAQQPQREQPEQKPPTNVAQADHPRHESGRQSEREQPKPKDELKKPNPKKGSDQNNDKDNGGG